MPPRSTEAAVRARRPAFPTRSATTCHFDYSGALSETVLLGNVAYRLGREIEWDAASLRVTNARDAEPLVDYDYQNGWRLLRR